jgi:hypothetical protein
VAGVATRSSAGVSLKSLGSLALGAALLAAWALPLKAWAVWLFGVVVTVIFVLVVLAHREHGRRLFAKPAVAAALVMYVIAVFTVVYAIVALDQAGAIRTNGDASPDSLGVASLVATAMGIAGGEVGAEVRHAARFVAHLQLLLVIGAVAGAGAAILRAVTGGDDGAGAPTPPWLGNPVLELYRHVYDRLTEEGGEVAWREVPVHDPERKRDAIQSVQSLPSPEVATEADARAVFERIIAGDLEYFYGISFWGSMLSTAVRPYTRHGAPG